MKKYLKILIIMIILLLSILILDVVSIYTRFKPIVGVYYKEDFIYRGILYDTYVCPQYTVPVIKSKFSKFSCKERSIIESIIDETVNMKNFTCASSLEEFYEDEENKYYFSCIKSQFVIVKYSNNVTKNVKEAFNNNEITIDDLKNYDIDFITISKDK